MDPTKTEPVAPSVSDVSGAPNQVSVAPTKEAAPASIDVGPIPAPESPVNEFLTSSSPEASPPPEVAPFARPVHVAQPPQQVINTASSQVPGPQVKPGSFPTTTLEANRIIKSKKYSIKDAIKWFATLLKFENLRKDKLSA